MNTNRTLYARNAFAAAALTLIGSVAAVPSFAQGVGTLSRAQVRAEAEQAVASGETDAMMGNSYGVVTQVRSHSVLTRAEVRADTVQALRDGSIDRQVGESDGLAVAPHASRRIL